MPYYQVDEILQSISPVAVNSLTDSESCCSFLHCGVSNEAMTNPSAKESTFMIKSKHAMSPFKFKSLRQKRTDKMYS